MYKSDEKVIFISLFNLHAVSIQISAKNFFFVLFALKNYK